MHDGFNRYLRTGHNTVTVDGFNRRTPGTDHYGGFDHVGTVDDNRYDKHRIHQRSHHFPGSQPGRVLAAR